jgi:hypothetical protein
MRLLLAALLAGHGIAHLPGFAVSWKLMSSLEIPYRTTALGGMVRFGDVGARVEGLLWLLMAVVFVALAASALLGTPWWRYWVQIAIMASILLCAMGWPDARLGLLANVVIGAVVAFSRP